VRVFAAVSMLMLLTTLAAAPTSQPTSTPTSQPTSKPASRPAAMLERLPLGSKNEFEYTPPQGMDGPHVQDDGNTVVYIAGRDAGRIVILLQPRGMEEVNFKIGQAIVDMLKKANGRDGRKMIIDTRIEKDSRFPLKVHQKFVLAGHTFDEVHLYKPKNYRVVEVGIICNADLPDRMEEIYFAGENVLNSMAAKGEKPPKPLAKPTPEKADVETCHQTRELARQLRLFQIDVFLKPSEDVVTDDTVVAEFHEHSPLGREGLALNFVR